MDIILRVYHFVMSLVDMDPLGKEVARGRESRFVHALFRSGRICTEIFRKHLNMQILKLEKDTELNMDM